MKRGKALSGLLVGVSLFLIAGCEEEKEPPKPKPLPPLTVCRNECRSASEKISQECVDELRAQGEFDRLGECSTKADTYSEKCRAECDAKHASS